MADDEIECEICENAEGEIEGDYGWVCADCAEDVHNEIGLVN